jgi:nitrogen fixation protein NifU and related proteins
MSDMLAGLYQQVILDHAKERHGDGPLEHADAEHFERNPTCGDEITVRVVLDDAGRITDLRWQGDGCSISMASASVLTDMAVGRTVDELVALTESFREMMRSRGAGEPDEAVLEDLVVFHGVSKFVMRVKCAMLAWVAAEAAVREATLAH